VEHVVDDLVGDLSDEHRNVNWRAELVVDRVVTRLAPVTETRGRERGSQAGFQLSHLDTARGQRYCCPCAASRLTSWASPSRSYHVLFTRSSIA
jgi:hypothetical protein